MLRVVRCLLFVGCCSAFVFAGVCVVVCVLRGVVRFVVCRLLYGVRCVGPCSLFVVRSLLCVCPLLFVVWCLLV